MALADYAAQNDAFALDGSQISSIGLDFPCCMCKYRYGNPDDAPCASCGHNANAVREEQDAAEDAAAELALRVVELEMTVDVLRHDAELTGSGAIYDDYDAAIKRIAELKATIERRQHEMEHLIRDIRTADTQGHFTHCGRNWIMAFKTRIERLMQEEKGNE